MVSIVPGRRIASVLISGALCLSAVLVGNASVARDTGDLTTTLFRDLELLPPDDLVIDRADCALGKMPDVWVRMKSSHLVKGDLPTTQAYCLKVLAVTAAESHVADLYIRLAMNEQGFSDYSHSGQSKYVANNEPGRTMAAILQAASAGSVAYTGVAGHTHDLPCALALDAGYSWASNSETAKTPVAFTAEEASDIAAQCYDPKVRQISVKGTPVPATKAGLLAGAWLAGK